MTYFRPKARIPENLLAILTLFTMGAGMSAALTLTVLGYFGAGIFTAFIMGAILTTLAWYGNKYYPTCLEEGGC